MASVSPVQVSSDALAQILQLAVSKSVDQATRLARLNLQLATSKSSEGVDQELLSKGSGRPWISRLDTASYKS
jgi:hypothetical protein